MCGSLVLLSPYVDCSPFLPHDLATQANPGAERWGIKCPNDAPDCTNKLASLIPTRAEVARFVLALSRRAPNICWTAKPLLTWLNMPTITSSLFGWSPCWPLD